MKNKKISPSEIDRLERISEWINTHSLLIHTIGYLIGAALGILIVNYI